jgi:hypothetical protein
VPQDGRRRTDETTADQELIGFLEQRARQVGDVPLTAEELSRAAGDPDAAARLARLKAARAAKGD